MSHRVWLHPPRAAGLAADEPEQPSGPAGSQMAAESGAGFADHLWVHQTTDAIGRPHAPHLGSFLCGRLSCPLLISYAPVVYDGTVASMRTRVWTSSSTRTSVLTLQSYVGQASHTLRWLVHPQPSCFPLPHRPLATSLASCTVGPLLPTLETKRVWFNGDSQECE